MTIQILGKGCPNCKKLEENVRQALETLGISAEIEKITDIGKIIEFGVMTTPALAINGVLISSGKVISKEQIIQILQSTEN